MTHTYNITGLTCGNCVAKAKSQLLMLGDITEAQVQLGQPQATLTMQKHVPLSTLQTALHKAGNYIITEAGTEMTHTDPLQESTSWLKTYKPILLIGAYITGISFLLQTGTGNFNWNVWMVDFMAAFFLTFSFFKLLDLKGFADSYATYDIIAKRWYGWGYLYAFTELALGIAFLVNFLPLFTKRYHSLSAVFLSVSFSHRCVSSGFIHSAVSFMHRGSSTHFISTT